MAKKSVKDIKDTRGAALSLLVGTFRKENEEWIKEKKLKSELMKGIARS